MRPGSAPPERPTPERVYHAADCWRARAPEIAAALRATRESAWLVIRAERTRSGEDVVTWAERTHGNTDPEDGLADATFLYLPSPRPGNDPSFANAAHVRTQINRWETRVLAWMRDGYWMPEADL